MRDPFYPDRVLDAFDSYCLCQYLRIFADTVAKRMLREFKTHPISSVMMSNEVETEAQAEAVEQMVDCVADERLMLMTWYDEVDFNQYLVNNIEKSCQVFITPHFLEHFDIHGITCW